MMTVTGSPRWLPSAGSPSWPRTSASRASCWRCGWVRRSVSIWSWVGWVLTAGRGSAGCTFRGGEFGQPGVQFGPQRRGGHQPSGAHPAGVLAAPGEPAPRRAVGIAELAVGVQAQRQPLGQPGQLIRAQPAGVAGQERLGFLALGGAHSTGSSVRNRWMTRTCSTSRAPSRQARAVSGWRGGSDSPVSVVRGPGFGHRRAAAGLGRADPQPVGEHLQRRPTDIGGLPAPDLQAISPRSTACRRTSVSHRPANRTRSGALNPTDPATTGRRGPRRSGRPHPRHHSKACSNTTSGSDKMRSRCAIRERGRRPLSGSGGTQLQAHGALGPAAQLGKT